MTKNLNERWVDLLNNLGLEKKSSLSSKWWSNLEEKYSEGIRKYHNLRHLEQMFSLFDKFESKIQDKPAVKLSIWFHE